MLLARASLLRSLLLFLFLTPLPSLSCLLFILVFFIFATLVSFCSLSSLAITTTDAFYTEHHCRGATRLHSWGFGAGDIPGFLGASWGAHSIPANHRPRSADSAACASNCHDTFKLQLRRLPLSPPTFHPSLSPVPLTIFSSPTGWGRHLAFLISHSVRSLPISALRRFPSASLVHARPALGLPSCDGPCPHRPNHHR